MTCGALNPMPEATPYRRSPDTVMRLARMGAAHPTRLSFLRQMLRRMQNENWRFERPVWEFDARGQGRAVYCAIGPERTYSLVAFGHDLPDEMRSDRVIATAWDATFTLFDGVPDADDLARLERNVPLQEAGRVSVRELSLSRANKSVRLFDHVVARLAAGQQPDAAKLAETGYLMRTTAVYGSGKFGAADRAQIADRPEMRAPFQAEMLSVWLTRAYTVDLVEHLAQMRGRCLRCGLGSGVAAHVGGRQFYRAWDGPISGAASGLAQQLYDGAGRSAGAGARPTDRHARDIGGIRRGAEGRAGECARLAERAPGATGAIAGVAQRFGRGRRAYA